MERLSYGRSAAINTHIVKAGLIQRLLPLCLEFPHNNILQTACCEIIRQAALPRLDAVGQAHALLTRILPDVKPGTPRTPWLLPCSTPVGQLGLRERALYSECRWSLESGLRPMWEPLFRPRMGAPPGKLPSDESSLIERVIEVLQTAQTVPSVAQRACTVGFALSVAAQMREAAGLSDVLQRSLEVCYLHTAATFGRRWLAIS